MVNKLKNKLEKCKPATLRKWLLGGLFLSIVLVSVDFICHHFGHLHAWQSPFYLVVVSFESLIIVTIAILSYKNKI